MTKSLKIITDACIKANPSIKDLVFGCDTDQGKITSVFESQGSYGYATIPYITNWNGTTGQATARWYSKENLGKILGRPITLADVLLALSDVGYVTIDSDGCFVEIVKAGNKDWKKFNDPKFGLQGLGWDLKETIENQSEETLEFLATLLS